MLLDREKDFHVVAEAASGLDAVSLVEDRRPEIVLLEVKLPGLSGIAAAKAISSKNDGARSVFVATQTEEGYVTAAFKAGARGYVAGDAAPTDLARAIRIVARGGLFLSPAISDEILRSHFQDRDLSGYERQVVCLVAAGYDEQEIATRVDRNSDQVRSDWLHIRQTLQHSEIPDVILRSVIGNPRQAEHT